VGMAIAEKWLASRYKIGRVSNCSGIEFTLSAAMVA
jgi:hypothetical protein